MCNKLHNLNGGYCCWQMYMTHGQEHTASCVSNPCVNNPQRIFEEKLPASQLLKIDYSWTANQILDSLEDKHSALQFESAMNIVHRMRTIADHIERFHQEALKKGLHG